MTCHHLCRARGEALAELCGSVVVRTWQRDRRFAPHRRLPPVRCDQKRLVQRVRASDGRGYCGGSARACLRPSCPVGEGKREPCEELKVGESTGKRPCACTAAAFGARCAHTPRQFRRERAARPGVPVTSRGRRGDGGQCSVAAAATLHSCAKHPRVVGYSSRSRKSSLRIGETWGTVESMCDRALLI